MELQETVSARTDAAKARLRRAGADLDASLQRPFALVSQHPLEALGAALALGLLSGRFPRASRSVLEWVLGSVTKR